MLGVPMPVLWARLSSTVFGQRLAAQIAFALKASGFSAT